MNKELLIKQIQKMDFTSDDFFDVFCAASEHYWQGEAAGTPEHLLYLMSLKGDGPENDLVVRLYSDIIKITKTKGSKATSGSFQLRDGDPKIYFEIYTDKKALSNLQSMLENAVIVKAKQPPQKGGTDE